MAKLSRMILKDFKGVPDGEYTFKELVNEICGKNGTGKTTLADAWFWFWTDKDYELHTNPEIHPDFMVESEPTVTLILDTGKQEIVLRKIQCDMRTKKQKIEGAPVRISNRYEINSVPKTQKDFFEDVKNIGIDGDNILLYEHPDYLLSQTVANRRAIIFPTAGDVTTLEVAETMPDCTETIELLKQGYKDDEILAMKKAEVKRCKEQLEALPNQIIGMERSKVVVDPTLAQRHEELTSRVEELTALKSTLVLKSNSEEYERQIREVESDKQAEYNKANTDRLVNLGEARVATDKAYDALQDAKRELSNLKMSGSQINDGYVRQFETKKRLSAELDAVRNESFSCDTICPTCGQEIPKERIDSAKQAWQEKHDAAIRGLVQRIAAADTNLSNYKKEGGELAEKKKDAELKAAECQANLELAQAEVAKYSVPVKPDLSAYDAKIAEIRKQKSNSDAYERQVNETTAELNAAKTALASVIRQMGQEGNNARIDEEISKLKQSQAEYVQARADAEKILYQMSLISQRKNELLSDAVNSHFTRVKWRLFVTQKNGEIKDDCTPLVLCSDGKFRDMTYSANTAAIQAAKLDICRGLQKFYGQDLPIWLDGAECFDEKNREALASMNAQLMLLCVTEDERLVIK